MRQVFDIFPFLNEVDILEIRLHELDPLVTKFIIIEGDETYGGDKRELVFPQIKSQFERFADKIIYLPVHNLSAAQACYDRDSGRIREHILRDSASYVFAQQNPQPDDVVIFSDCDEIPSRHAIEFALTKGQLDANGIHRLKQHSYYYDVNTEVDYGHDFASRARVGLVKNLSELDGAFYAFRMFRRDDKDCPAIEDGGWHYSYFGGERRIIEKVEAMSPFLKEYKLFGSDVLKSDIRNRKDLHHRRTEMPETFKFVIPGKDDMPLYLWNNKERFPHFFKEGVEQWQKK